MMNGRELAMQNGGLRHSTFWKDARDYCMKFESCQRWAKSLGKTTTKRYFKEMYRVAKETGMSPEDLINFKIEGLASGRDPETRHKFFQCEKKLEDSIEEAEKSGMNPLMMKNAMISFFKHNGVSLASNFAEHVEQKEKAEEEYRVIEDAEEVEKIAEYLDIPPRERNVAILWFLESTGIRRGTLPLLTFGDLYECRWVSEDGKRKLKFFNWFEEKEGDLDKDVPLMVYIPSEKLKGKGKRKYKGIRQVTFVHFVAYEKFLKYVEWVKRLKRYEYDEYHKPIRKISMEITAETPLFISSRLKDLEIQPLKAEAFYNRMTDAYILAKGNGIRYTPHDFKRFVETFNGCLVGRKNHK